MTLAGVDDEDAGLARRCQHRGDRADGAAKLGYVVAQHGAEAAGLDEIPLHVDDDERGGGRLELEGIGLSRYFWHGQPPSEGSGRRRDRENLRLALSHTMQ